MSFKKAVTFLLLMTLPLASEAKKPVNRRDCCQAGWREHHQSCYYLINTPTKFWYDAQFRCQGMGAGLPIIRSADEQDFVNGLLREMNTASPWWGAWLGLQQGDGNKYYWVDGNPLDGGYTGWSSGEPNDPAGEHCTHMWGKDGPGTAGAWNDVNCDASLYGNKHPFPVVLCQKPC